MQVLYVINSLGAGGAEQSLAEMIPGLASRGIHVTVVCLDQKAEGFESRVTDRGHEIVYLRARSRPGQLVELRRLIRQRRPDVVHTTLFESDVLGRVASIRSGAPVVTSLVNTSYDPVRMEDPNVRAWKLRLAQAIDGFTGRHLTSRFHALTEAVRDANVAALRLDPDRVTVIGRGRDTARLGAPTPERRAAGREMLGLNGTTAVITVGRREFQKGQSVLVDAFAEVRRSRPDVVLLVVGRDGSASRTLQDQVRSLGLQDSVVFLGHRDDVGDLLAAADVFAFPSLYEGFGGAVIEAMAMALPIVASDLPALREVTRGCAILVTPGREDELAEGLHTILADREAAAAMGRRARDRFLDSYTLDAVVDHMEQLYRSAPDGARWQTAGRSRPDVG